MKLLDISLHNDLQQIHFQSLMARSHKKYDFFKTKTSINMSINKTSDTSDPSNPLIPCEEEIHNVWNIFQKTTNILNSVTQPTS